jgi:hypothetical protein
MHFLAPGANGLALKAGVARPVAKVAAALVVVAGLPKTRSGKILRARCARRRRLCDAGDGRRFCCAQSYRRGLAEIWVQRGERPSAFLSLVEGAAALHLPIPDLNHG